MIGVAILDADDLWHQQKLALQKEYIQKYNLTCLATMTDLFEKDTDVDLTHTIIINELDKGKCSEFNLNHMLVKNRIVHSSMIMQKALAVYDERFLQEDYELWLRLLHQGEKLYLLGLRLTFHRIHEQQSFEGTNHMRYFMRSCALQMKYCLITGKVSYIFYVFGRLIYHLVFNRRWRLFFGKYKIKLAA